MVGGLYRYVRNPMYLAVAGVILGQALIFGRLVLIGYALLVGALMWAFATWYEEPALARRFGSEYRAVQEGRARMVAAAAPVDRGRAAGGVIAPRDQRPP